MDNNESDTFSEEQYNHLVNKLVGKGAIGDCPICGNSKFEIADGFFFGIIQTDIDSLTISGSGIPSIVTICTRCGFIAQHAVGALDLSPELFGNLVKMEGD